MTNEAQRPQGPARTSNGFMRSFSSYLRVVSNGASTMASTVRSAGASVVSSLADRDEDAGRDQVLWAGFDKLECEDGTLQQALLLGYGSGFEVWDVEDADDVRKLVSRHDGPVSFLQLLKKPFALKRSEDKFAHIRPLIAVVGEVSLSGSNIYVDTASTTCNDKTNSNQELGIENSYPSSVYFYSLRTHDYVHVLKFRTEVYSVRCSPHFIAILQAAQIHCFHAGTLEKEYAILTCPIAPGTPGPGIGYGPLAVGPRWLAYSGSRFTASNRSRVSPQHLTSNTSYPQSTLSGSLVAHYAKESSKQLAAGIMTIGDIGYKKLSRYYSEKLAGNDGCGNHGGSSFKSSGTNNSHAPDTYNYGMVIVEDIALKSVIVQFRAHRSPIAALCFDPSGTLLVTASIKGHNVNVFQIMPSLHGTSSDSDATGTCIHLYSLQRGITNAVLQDISFSNDSQWIMISSLRGTSHLFSVSSAEQKLQLCGSNLTGDSWDPDSASNHGSQSSGRSKLDAENLCPLGHPVTLSAVSRIRNGSGWKDTVSSAAAAALGRVSPLSGAIASVFHNCKGSDVLNQDVSSLKTTYYLLVFSPSGIIQYVLRQSTGEDSGMNLFGSSTISNELSPESDTKLVVDALQKWDVCHKRSRKDRGECVDFYGEDGNGDSSNLLQKGAKKGTNIFSTNNGANTKVKNNTDERRHMYISEVELHMHAPQVPLWAKPEIYFQVMKSEITGTDDSTNMSGEIEIEMIPTRTIGARSKELIPAFDYHPSSRFGYPSRNGSIRSVISEDGRLSRRSSCSSLSRMTENEAPTKDSNNISENSWDTFHKSSETIEDFVNNSKDRQYVKDDLKFVNNKEGLQVEAHLEHVNSNEEMEMENHFLENDK